MIVLLSTNQVMALLENSAPAKAGYLCYTINIHGSVLPTTIIECIIMYDFNDRLNI